MANAASMLQKLSSYSLKREEDLPRIKEQCDELVTVAGQLSGEQLRKIQEIRDQANANMERLRQAPSLWLEATRAYLQPKGAHLPWSDLETMSDTFQKLFSQTAARTQLISLNNAAYERLRGRVAQQIRVRLAPVSCFSCLACCFPGFSVKYEFAIFSSRDPANLLEEWLSKSTSHMEDIQSRLTLPSPADPSSQTPSAPPALPRDDLSSEEELEFQPDAESQSASGAQQEEEEYVDVPSSNSQNYHKLLEDEEL